MKKIILPLVTLLFIIILITIFTLVNTTKEITSSSEIDLLKKDAYLDILVNLGDFSKDNYSERNLLDIAMQYATKLNLINEINNDNLYLQYAYKDDVHNVIYELTGLEIEAPIEIDDFYYLYDSENDYYYYLGSSPAYYEVSKVNSVKTRNNHYLIDCMIFKMEDGELTENDEALIKLKYNPKNSMVKYQVEQITIKEN